MKPKIALSFFLIILSAYLEAQPGTVKMTPVQSLNLKTETIEIPAKYVALFPAGKTLKVPQGYKVKVFYVGGLNKPRFMSFDANGVLHVADEANGAIYAMPDKNHDGVADTIIVAALGFQDSHDVKFYRGAMYVTDSLNVWKCLDANGDGIYESRSIFIDSIGYGAARGGHHTRTLVFDSLNRKAYLSIGSSCNVCRENAKAIIEQYNDDGTGKRTFATGTRNAVGMALHPATNQLWANNNGSDLQGNEVPPEWIDIVRNGGFYGHPLAYANQVWFNFNASNDYKALLPITSADSVRIKTMIEPAALIRAHSAPMALTFLNNSFAPTYSNGILSALHGSWNSPQSFRGYKVVYLDLSSAADTTVNFVADFIDGFLTDTINRIYWGRPVGLVADHEGSIYLSSDETNKFILKIYPEAGNGIKNDKNNENGIEIFPNPAREKISVTIPEGLLFSAPENYGLKCDVYSSSGTLVYSQQITCKSSMLDISKLRCGMYAICIGSYHKIFIHE